MTQKPRHCTVLKKVRYYIRIIKIRTVDRYLGIFANTLLRVEVIKKVVP